MAILTDTGFPPTFLNRYILSELEHYELISDIDLINPTPMIPAQVSTNIEDLYNDSIQIRQSESPILIVYDRLMRFRPTQFYLHKREQLIYFIYSTDVGKLIDTVRVISSALDREDSSAQDVNSYNFLNPLLKASSPPIVFSSKNISNKALDGRIATITTSTAHGLEEGDAVEITGVMTGSPAILDTRFNGIQYVTDKTSDTVFRFTKDLSYTGDVNSIASSGSILKKESTPFNVAFHSTRVYQADESRDVAELASARTLFVNKLIVEYDYHIKNSYLGIVNGQTVEVDTRYK
jgi:hypothetical protein